MPKAWADLIEGLTLLAQHGGLDPLYCEHDKLTVMADPELFTPAELDRLSMLGFFADYQEDVFVSYRFGGA